MLQGRVRGRRQEESGLNARPLRSCRAQYDLKMCQELDYALRAGEKDFHIDDIRYVSFQAGVFPGSPGFPPGYALDPSVHGRSRNRDYCGCDGSVLAFSLLLASRLCARGFHLLSAACSSVLRQ